MFLQKTVNEVASVKSDPIGDLFATPTVVVSVPSQPSAAPRTESKGNIGWILLAIGLIGFYFYKHDLVPSLIPVQRNIFGESGLHVLIVYESQNGMPKSLNGEVRSYLDSHCAVDPKTKNPQRLFADQNVKFAADADMWKKAMQRGQKELPWIVIGSDKGNFEGPLPGSPAAVLDLLKKYGGP